MNNQQALLGLSLLEVGIPLSAKTFEERLIIQKAVYLMQGHNISLGYSYRWYLRGPYSRGVSEDLSYLYYNTQAQEELGQYELGAKTRAKLSPLKDLLIVENNGNILECAKHLELLASVLFLIKTHQSVASDISGIKKILEDYKKPFDRNDVKGAITELRQYFYAL